MFQISIFLKVVYAFKTIFQFAETVH